MTLVGFTGSLLVMVTVPVDSPDAVGRKVRDIVAVAPALMVFGVAMPVSPNAAPDTATIEMFRSALPEFEIVTLEFPVEPTPIDPNSTDVALRDICGPVEAAVAERFTVAGELPSLPCTVIVPFTFPELVGAKATVRFADWPVPRDMGRALPERLNWGLEKVAWVMETDVLPVLETETVWVLCFPTVTFPKFKLEEPSRNAASRALLVPFTRPEQPPRNARERSVRTKASVRVTGLAFD
jgi:hypothetical protein